VVDPLTKALAEHGLTTEQYDIWAAHMNKATFAGADLETRGRAADWIRAGGHAAIRRAQPAPETETETVVAPEPTAEPVAADPLAAE